MDDQAFKIVLLPDDIIFVERQGEPAEWALRTGFARIGELARQQRERGKPVLILNYTKSLAVSPRVLELLLDFDFDRFAVYGSSQQVNNKRDLMVRANGMERKIASFQSRSDALAWLQAFARK